MEPTRQSCFAPESRSGRDIFEVNGRILSKEISLTTRNTSSLVIDRLCDQARREGRYGLCMLVLRLPCAIKADKNEHDWSDSEAAGRPGPASQIAVKHDTVLWGHGAL